MIEAPTLWALAEARGEATPDGVLAVDEEGRKLTFAGLRDDAARAAAGIAALGIEAGHVVTWQLPTWIESMVLVAALSRLGVVQNPVIPIYRDREVGFVTDQARSRLIIVPSVWRGFDYEAMANRVAPEGAAVLVADKALPDGDPATLPPPAGDGSQVRWLFYTSGTTAEPKGAQHTDATVMAAGRAMALRNGFGPDDRNALVFPFTHIGGATWLAGSLMVGLTNVLIEAFDAAAIDVLRREDITIAAAGTPFHLAYLAAQRALPPDERLFPSIRMAPGGGAPKPPQLHYDVKAELGGPGVVSAYGLTEAPILTGASVDDDDEVLAHTEGHVTPGVELRVVTLEGAVAGPGEEGEVRAKGPQVMLGYLDSSLDAEAFDDEGWFRTGDLGSLDAAGNLTITGRLKDVIIRKGENISAKEIEDLLYQHPSVGDVAVIGLPDAERGERMCAVVAPAQGAAPLAFVDMQEFLREAGLMGQKVPEQLEIVEAVPRNPAGKALKADLKARFGA